jgi:hypothetical protein
MTVFGALIVFPLMLSINGCLLDDDVGCCDDEML